MFKIKTDPHSRLLKMFLHVVKGSEVANGKPAPDIFQECARRFKGPTPKPENCLAFEDSPNGVEAAKSAGMVTVMMPDKR